MKREYFLDHLRLTLCVLVILHHAAIAFGAMGGWCYVSPVTLTGITRTGLSTLLAVNQAFFMSLFFFISGFLMPASFDRKGAWAFIRDRLVRLGVPLLVYVVVIHPTLLFWIAIHTGTTTDHWLPFAWNTLTRNPNVGHMWFVAALLLFEVAYAVYRACLPFSISRRLPDQPPGHRWVLGFILVSGVVAFGLRHLFPIGSSVVGVQLGFFTLYVAAYGVGILARRKQWAEQLTFLKARLWVLAGLIAAPTIAWAVAAVERKPGLMQTFVGGWHWQALTLALWEALVCVGMCCLLWLGFRQYLNKPLPGVSLIAPDSYGAYVIHPVILVGMTMLFETLPVPAFIMFILVSAITVAVCLLVTHGLRQIPVVRRIL